MAAAAGRIAAPAMAKANNADCGEARGNARLAIRSANTTQARTASAAGFMRVNAIPWPMRAARTPNPPSTAMASNESRRTGQFHNMKPPAAAARAAASWASDTEAPSTATPARPAPATTRMVPALCASCANPLERQMISSPSTSTPAARNKLAASGPRKSGNNSHSNPAAAATSSRARRVAGANRMASTTAPATMASIARLAIFCPALRGIIGGRPKIVV